MANILQRIWRSWTVDNPNSIIYQMFGGSTALSGESVSPDKAPQIASVYACVTIIADTIASLPFNVYIETEQGSKVQKTHPLNRLLAKQPNEKYNSIDFRRALFTQLLLRGNAYVLPMRTGNAITGLELIHPDHVQVTYEYGQLSYHVYLYDKMRLDLTPDQIIHIKAFTLDGYNGVSPITYARETIGSALSSAKHLAQYYGKGTVPQGTLTTAGTLRDPEKQKAIGQAFDGAVSQGRTPVLTEGLEYKPITIPLRDSQFIETQKWTAEEICRIYRVPPHMVGMMEHGSYNNSIEAQSHNFIQYCLRPWVELVEMEFENKLLNNPQFHVEIDMTGLLRGDIQTQVQRHVSYWNVGAMNVNEIRRENGFPPIPGGEEFMKPMHMANQNDVNNGSTNNPKAGPKGESEQNTNVVTDKSGAAD